MDEANKELIELTLNDDEFWPWLAQATQYSVEQCQQEISKLILAGTPEALQLLQQICVAYLQYKGLASLVESNEGLTLMARDGMKISYIGYLRGKCPNEYEILYYNTGGHICKRCVKKKNNGGSFDATVGKIGKGAMDAFKQNYLYRNGGITKYLNPAGAIGVRKEVPIKYEPIQSDTIDVIDPYKTKVSTFFGNGDMRYIKTVNPNTGEIIYSKEAIGSPITPVIKIKNNPNFLERLFMNMSPARFKEAERNFNALR